MEDIMSTHPNVAVIERMPQAIVENDRETLTRIFTDDMVFHGRDVSGEKNQQVGQRHGSRSEHPDQDQRRGNDQPPASIHAHRSSNVCVAS